jgi:hypothetical protein
VSGESNAGHLEDGWYLMSTSELERELARRRGANVAPTGAPRLSVEEALDFRNAGNLPDPDGRTLRLVIHVEDEKDLENLGLRRLEFEPDYHDAPDWRREGSAPVNIVPLRRAGVAGPRQGAWWEETDLGGLEQEWARSGSVAGLKVPGEYRSFVYKTVLALQSAGREITVDSVVGSIARWLPPAEAEEIRTALRAANR